MRRKASGTDVRELLQAKGGEAVAFLSELMNDPNAKPELRFKAAEGILDRILKDNVKGEGGSLTDIRFEGILDEWSQ